MCLLHHLSHVESPPPPPPGAEVWKSAGADTEVDQRTLFLPGPGGTGIHVHPDSELNLKSDNKASFHIVAYKD